jgi:drug/metabolite transporter (DMT)-like permease
MPPSQSLRSPRGLSSPRGPGVAAMALCALLWSLAGLFIKFIDWNPFAIACGRSAIAALFIWIWVRKPRFTFSAPQILAALSNAATMLLFIYANKATTSANAILLQYGSPIYVAIIGVIVLKEKPRAEHWSALAFVALGMGLFFVGGPNGGLGGGSLLGDLAAAVAGLTFALYSIFMRMQKDGSPVESALLSHLITAPIAFVVCLFLPAPKMSAASVAAILGLGVLQIGLASVLFSVGIKRITAIDANIIGVIEPVLNPVWVFLFMGEKPGANALLGGAVIIAAVLVSTMIGLRRERKAGLG